MNLLCRFEPGKTSLNFEKTTKTLDIESDAALSRKITSREGVFPEDVAVAAVAAVTQIVRIALLWLLSWHKVTFCLVFASSYGVKMISLTDSQSKSFLMHGHLELSLFSVKPALSAANHQLAFALLKRMRLASSYCSLYCINCESRQSLVLTVHSVNVIHVWLEV